MRTRFHALRSPKIVIGALIVGVIIAFVLIAPLFDHTDPAALTSDVLQGPSKAHWLGTTQTGEDVLSQLEHGGRVSLAVGGLSGVFATFVAVVIGLVGGYARGKVDGVLSALTTVFLVIPGLPLLIVIAGYLPSKGVGPVAVVIAITAWAAGARSLRAQTMSLRSRDYVTAARAVGETSTRIVFSEVLRNELPLVASTFLFTVIFGILTEAGLSFLGLSSLTTISWGTMLFFAQNAQALLLGAWWWFIPPGLLIALFGSGLALINFGIDELGNPRLRAMRHHKPSRIRVAAVPHPRAESNTLGVHEPADEPPVVHPSTSPAAPTVLEVCNLSVDYGAGATNVLHAVRDVNITLHRGEILGLAGESGSGKSTLTNAIARLLRPPGEIVAGSVVFHSSKSDARPVDVIAMNRKELSAFRWAELSVVFQSAMSSLNPVMRIGVQFDDVIRRHRPDMSSAERVQRSKLLLTRVSLEMTTLSRFPHELSGGMKQRVAIALALALQPQIIIMDEPTTALDMLVQRQIVEQVIELQRQDGFAVIFTTHDLSLLLEICDRVAIMRNGRVVEIGSAVDIQQNPIHDYTKALLESLRQLGVSVRGRSPADVGSEAPVDGP